MARMNRKEYRETKRREASARMQAAIESIQSGDDFRAFLALAARFHNYSWRNWMLVYLQRPDATRVAGYRAWQKLGRQVRKGEKGICILAPCTYQKETDDGDTETSLYFRSAHVFDISQTDGDEIPSIPVPLLTGEDGVELYQALKTIADTAGITIDETPIDRSAAGYWCKTTKTIRVDPSLAQLQRTKTLAHELAHALAGHDGSTDSQEAETVAEAVAYLVCDACGLDTSERSFPYVATFAKTPDAFAEVLGAIHAASKQILAELDRIEPAIGGAYTPAAAKAEPEPVEQPEPVAAAAEQLTLF